MPKATIEYSLPEENNDYVMAVHANQAYTALYDVDHAIRSLLNHSEDDWLGYPGAQNALENLRNIVAEDGVLDYYV